MKCIYCLEDKDSYSFTKVEHVLPESFGSFENNLTLRDIVCDECNEFFGKNIELYLARDTFEGSTLRYKYKVKDAKAFKHVGKRSRLIIKVDEGPFKGYFAYRDHVDEFGIVQTIPCPQVGFLKKAGDYEYHLLDDLPEKGSLLESNYNFDAHLSFIAIACDSEQAKELLTSKGFEVKSLETLGVSGESSKRLYCEVEGEIDDIVFRGIAKIGFNYLAKWEGRDLVLNKSFDPVRRFIRWGETPQLPLKGAQVKPFFHDEKEGNKKIIGHIIAVEWSSIESSLIATVSLFNWVRYLVRLAKDDAAQFRTIRRGHFFNTRGHNIIEMRRR